MADTHTFHVSKSICLLSHYSFDENFERWLTYLQVVECFVCPQISIFYNSCSLPIFLGSRQ